LRQEIRWQSGNRPSQIQLEATLSDTPHSDQNVELLFERPGRRRLFKIRTHDGDWLFVKQLFTRSLGAVRGGAAAARLDAAGREWRALTRLYRAGVAVPEPIALGTLANGDRVVATRFVEGSTLKASLEEPGRCTRIERNAMLLAVGRLVHGFHAAGYVHRDLHWGNILISKSGPLLLDLQAALPTSMGFARRRDLGALDYSVSGLLTISDRTRVRAAALGFEGALGPAERRALRAVGAASLASGRAHAASRTRRSLRPGRLYAPIRIGVDRGLRRREASEPDIASALAACNPSQNDQNCEILKADARAQVFAVSTGELSWIIKRYRSGGWLRRAADLFRGSPARRAWRGGHGLMARGIGTALPVAFVERRRFGVPVASAIVMEDLRGLEVADDCPTDWAGDREILTAVSRLAIGLHRRGAIHGDLKASHVLLEREANRIHGRLIDLEGVRFRRRLSDRTRIHALAQLNASLPDHISDAERVRAFRRYAAAIPFRGDPDRCLREIVDVSMARQHRWTGNDCALANRNGP
jgi:tRNA A-37 threonylcarbamoyl transferase component Bud32